MLGKTDWSSSPQTIPTNGPYMIASYGAKEMLIKKNTAYWDAASVKIQAVRIVFIEDDIESTDRYNSGEIDWLSGAMDLESLINRDALQFNAMFATHYWYFNCASGPWAKSEVRRALQLLLPWKTIRDAEVYTNPAKSLVLPLSGYKGAKAIDRQDADAARELLANAGFPEGSGLPELTILIPDGEDSKRIATIMKDAWEKELSLSVTIEIVKGSRFYTAAKDKPYTISLTSWIGDFADPLAFLDMWTANSGLNTANYREEGYDALIAKSMGEANEERLATLSQAEKMLLDSGAVMPISHQLAVNIVDSEYIRGWYKNALDIHPFKYLEYGEIKAAPNVVKAY